MDLAAGLAADTTGEPRPVRRENDTNALIGNLQVENAEVLPERQPIGMI